MTVSDWTEVRIGDLASFKHGYPFRGQYFRDSPTEYLLVTPGNFLMRGGFQLREDRDKYYDGPIPSDYVLTPGDLLVTMTDLSRETDTLGYPAFVPEIPGVICLHNQRLGKAHVQDPERLLERFLYYVLCSDGYRAEVLAGSTGTTVKHTAPSRIEAYRFLLPPPGEQQAIAEMLGALDGKIELNRRMNQTLEELGFGLFRSWFIDFDPVQAKLCGRRPVGVPDEAADIFPSHFTDSELGPLPAGWSIAPLDAIVDFLNGLALQRFPAGDGPSLPVIKIAEIRAQSTHGAERASTNLPSQYVVQDGDILFSWSGSLLVDVWCNGAGALNQHIFKVSSSHYPKWFYLNWLREHMDSFRAIAADKATTMGHIRRHHLTEAKVVLPPSSLLEILDAVQAPLLEQVIANRLESRTLADMRDVLLPALLSGEISVRTAERAVGEVI